MPSRIHHRTLPDRIPSALFAMLTAALVLPPKFGPKPFALLALVILIQSALVISRRVKPSAPLSGDLAALVYALFLGWHLAAAHTRWLDPVFFPPPESILRLFFTELPAMAQGAIGSLAKLAAGYFLALALGIGFGVLFSANKRLLNAAVPIAKALGPIPPVIYIPYAICFLPGLVAAQIFVIFIGAFWPVFLSTLNGIQNIPRSQIDAARTLNLSRRALRTEVLLPAALPSICVGAVLGLVFAFILLTAAELIGSSSGAGWYIKNYADYGDFARVIVGVAFIGVLVLAVTSVTDRVERRLLSWLD